LCRKAGKRPGLKLILTMIKLATLPSPEAGVDLLEQLKTAHGGDGERESG
jgi:hypothetical protein